MGMTGANGLFTTSVPPLTTGECIYAFDTCPNRVSPVACAVPPAPVPAPSLRLLGVALGLLSVVALFGLERRRRRV